MKTRRKKNRHYINSKVNITILLLIILISTVFSIYPAFPKFITRVGLPLTFHKELFAYQ